jgi:hypothetical protein
MMERRGFLSSVVIASVFPFEYDDGDGAMWGLADVGNEEIRFRRYTETGAVDADCVVSGVVSDWTVRVRLSDGFREVESFEDRAAALEFAKDWMRDH